MKAPTSNKIFLCMASLLIPLAGHSQVLVGDFQFNNTLSSSVTDSGSTPSLVNPGTGGSGNGGAGTFTSSTINGNTLGTLSMPAASGLSLNVAGLLASGVPSSYTVALLFDPSTTSHGFQSVFDPSGGHNDNHTYLYNGQVIFFDGGEHDAGSIAANTWTQVIESVSVTSGSAVVQFEVTPVGGTAVYTSLTYTSVSINTGYEINGNYNQLNFFRDDNGDDFQAGSVARVEVYNGALSQSQMASLDLTQEAAIPEPQTWATLACGLGCLIIFRRGRSSGRV